MTSIIQKIYSLPKEIIILIDEYNVEHRPKMNLVLILFKQYKNLSQQQ